MTETTTPATGQLTLKQWSDEQLKVIAFGIATQYLMDKSVGKATPMTELIQAKMIEMRDAILAEADDVMAGNVRRLHEDITPALNEVERLKAGAWQPVEDGEYGSLLVENNGSAIAVALYDDQGYKCWQGCDLGDEFRVMRKRKESAPPGINDDPMAAQREAYLARRRGKENEVRDGD